MEQNFLKLAQNEQAKGITEEKSPAKALLAVKNRDRFHMRGMGKHIHNTRALKNITGLMTENIGVSR
jgi:uncharacterized protein YifE (UPF0438 family)